MKKKELKSYSHKRKHIRFAPTEMTIASIEVGISEKNFRTDLIGFVVEEGHGGCCVVTVTTDAIQLGQKYRVQVGKLPILCAEVVWLTTIDTDLIRFGLKYLDS